MSEGEIKYLNLIIKKEGERIKINFKQEIMSNNITLNKIKHEFIFNWNSN